MSKDHLERRTYRKSPGRQYGYDYDPLRSQNGSAEEAGSRSQRGFSSSRSGALLSHRPDPRRTRQLMRQSIIASKRGNEEEMEPIDFPEQEHHELHNNPIPARASRRPVLHRDIPEPRPSRATSRVFEPGGSRSTHRRGTSAVSRHPEIVEHSLQYQSPLPPNNALLVQDEEYTDQWHDLAGIDPEVQREEKLSQHLEDEYNDDSLYGYDDAYAYDLEGGYDQEPAARPSRSSIKASGRNRRAVNVIDEPEQNSSDRIYTAEDENYDYEYEYEEDRASVPRARKKRKLSRRGLLWGAGIAAAGAVGVAAYETIPKIPQAVGNVGTSVEQQVQDAFNRGVTQGANQARQEIINGLESIEGFTLDGAIGAAYLTRVAYDVFVSPVVHFGSALTGNFLNGMLGAFKTARGLLAGIYQDNATLVAIQKVLESWVNQVNQMPKKIDAITDSDLDGAQAYLRALQRKINAEKAQINQPKTPSKPTSTPTPTSPGH